MHGYPDPAGCLRRDPKGQKQQLLKVMVLGQRQGLYPGTQKLHRREAH